MDLYRSVGHCHFFSHNMANGGKIFGLVYIVTQSYHSIQLYIYIYTAIGTFTYSIYYVYLYILYK